MPSALPTALVVIRLGHGYAPGRSAWLGFERSGPPRKRVMRRRSRGAAQQSHQTPEQATERGMLYAHTEMLARRRTNCVIFLLCVSAVASLDAASSDQPEAAACEC